jgi:NitT/TauT family transport system substrate-binding protein
MSTNSKVRSFTLGLIVLLTLVFLGNAMPAVALEKVVLRLNWIPWSMHTAFYTAAEKGFYGKEGLEVEIRPAAGATQGPLLVGSGSEHFGLALTDIFINAKGNGVPVVAVSADQPDTPLCIFSLKKTGILKPTDLIGKNLGHAQASSNRILIDLAFETAGIDPKKIPRIEIPPGAEIQLMLAGKIDAAEGFYYGQPVTLKDKGFETNQIILRDLGLSMYGTVLYTSKQIAQKRPDLVEKFLRGTLNGLMYTYKHTNESVAYILKFAPERSLPLEVEKLKKIFDIYRCPDYREKGWGFMTDRKWASGISYLEKGGGFKGGSLKPSELYTNEFITRVPESKHFATMLFSD